MVQFADNLESAIIRAEQEQEQLLWLPRLVHIRADITGLDDATIHFGLLRCNPLPNFERLLAEGGKSIQSWLAPFGALRIDQIFFLLAWSSVPHTPNKIVQHAGLSLGIARPGDDYKRWLVTFPISRQGKWVAWCVEIDMCYKGAKVDMLEIVLCKENMLLLER